MATLNVRKTARRSELDVYAAQINALKLSLCHATRTNGAIADGTTDGRLQLITAVSFAVDGALKSKAATDDLWNLAAQTDTADDEYLAYWLYLDASGTATIAAGTAAATEALAIAALPEVTLTKSVIGVYVAGPETDFNGAAGLAAQGTIYDGIPGTWRDLSSQLALVSP
jgi:hypothetical protein